MAPSPGTRGAAEKILQAKPLVRLVPFALLQEMGNPPTRNYPVNSEPLLHPRMLPYRTEKLFTRPKIVLSTMRTLCLRVVLISLPSALPLLNVGLTLKQLIALHPRPDAVAKTGYRHSLPIFKLRKQLRRLRTFPRLLLKKPAGAGLVSF